MARKASDSHNRVGEAALRRGAWNDARRRFRASLRRSETAAAHEGLGWAEWWLDRAAASFAARFDADAHQTVKGMTLMPLAPVRPAAA